MIVIARILACVCQWTTLLWLVLGFLLWPDVSRRKERFFSTVNRMEGCTSVLWDFVCLLFPKNKSPANTSCLILLQSRDDFCHWCLLAILFFAHSSSFVSVAFFPFSPSFKTSLLSCNLFFFFPTVVQTSSAEIVLCPPASEQLIPQQNLPALIPSFCCELKCEEQSLCA